jgi:energy-coupling factor transport system permease protein
MFSRQLWEAEVGRTPVHRLDGRIKLMLLAVLGTGVILIDSPRTLFLLLTVTLAGHLAAKTSLRRWALLALFLLIAAWGSMFSQAIFYNQEPRNPILCLIAPATPILGRLTDGVYIYQEGLVYGAVQAMRSCTMLSYGFLLCWTTDPRELLRSLVFWRLPYELSFMAVTGLRFLPVVIGETATVITAQRLRGFAARGAMSPFWTVRTAFQTLWPVLARSIRRAVTLAMSVESRGFGSGWRMTAMPPLTPWDRAALAGCLVAVLVAGAAKLLYIFQFNGWAHFADLRLVYDFARQWL